MAAEKTGPLSLPLRSAKDETLREKMIRDYARLVESIALKFIGMGEPLEDLIQVGNVGLLNAIDRYDPRRNSKFSTYATPTIRGEIQRHLRDRCWDLKVPRSLKELIKPVNNTRDRLFSRLGRLPSNEEIARELDITEEEVGRAMEASMCYRATSFEQPMSSPDGSGHSLTVGETIEFNDPDIGDIDRYGDLWVAIGKLSPHIQAVIWYRFFMGLSQEKTSRDLNFSPMNVSRLEKRGIIELRMLLDA